MKIYLPILLFALFTPVLTNASIWEEGTPIGNGYYSLESLGDYYWTADYGDWAYHSWLGWIEARSDELDSFQFFRLDGGSSNRGELFWTSSEQFPVVYSMAKYAGSWIDSQYWAMLEPEKYKKFGVLRSGDAFPMKADIVWAYRYDSGLWEYVGDRQHELPFEEEFRNNDLESILEDLQFRSITPLPEESRTLLPGVLQEAYTLYESFYDLSIEEPYQTDAIIVIQDEINISVYEVIAKQSEQKYYGYNLLYEMTLKPFKPDLGGGEKAIVSAQNIRIRQLSEFLAFDDIADSIARKDFLDPILTPMRSAWGRQFDVKPAVLINNISFDQECARALIDFSYPSDAGYEALYEKIGGEWVERYTKIVRIP